MKNLLFFALEGLYVWPASSSAPDTVHTSGRPVWIDSGDMERKGSGCISCNVGVNDMSDLFGCDMGNGIANPSSPPFIDIEVELRGSGGRSLNSRVAASSLFFFGNRSVVLRLGRSFLMRAAADGEGLRFCCKASSLSLLKVLVRGDGISELVSKELPLTSGVSGGVCIWLKLDSLRGR